MNMNDSNPCFPYSTDEKAGLSDFSFSEASLSAVITRLKMIETMEEFAPLSAAMVKQEDLFTLVRSLALNFIDQHRLYLDENCTSIYDYCAPARGRVRYRSWDGPQ